MKHMAIQGRAFLMEVHTSEGPSGPNTAKVSVHVEFGYMNSKEKQALQEQLKRRGVNESVPIVMSVLEPTPPTEGFEPGEQVMLKSGGPTMTVDCKEASGLFRCTWFDMMSNRYVKDVFAHTSLKKVPT